MKIHCTRPGCPRPENFFADLDDENTLITTQQKYCTSCGMPLILAGRYIPSRLLGKGGFGAAFLARDRYTPTKRQCVAKQFQPPANLNPQQLQIAKTLFEREAEVLEQLGNEHPQIPNLYAFFPLIVPGIKSSGDDQFFYLVQKFIDGEDLEHELARKGKLTEEEIREILREVLKVLSFVHTNGSIHRDIKPSNIMREKGGRLYLLDFGAVKQVTNAPGAAAGRSTGIFSMGFAPPEQMAGSQVYPSTDLYALAATCLNLLTGKDTEELYDSYNNNWDWKPQAQGVSPQLAEVLDKMLRRTPRERFQSAQEVLDALKPPQKYSPPPPPPTRTPTPTPKPTPTPPPIQQPPPVTTPAPTPVQSPVKVKQGMTFSLIETLGAAAFTGFEGGLLFVAFDSLFDSPGVSMGLFGMVLAGLIFAEFRRFIEKWDFTIIGVITLLLVMFVPLLNDAVGDKAIILGIAIFAAAAAVAITALFRLIYLLLSKFL
ncbi:MAG: serine/threonine-protein kinase [Spirulinaceae cyanobacterium]